MSVAEMSEHLSHMHDATQIRGMLRIVVVVVVCVFIFNFLIKYRENILIWVVFFVLY